jgi:hypothetical protein
MSCKKLKHITTKHNKERQAPCVSRMAQYKPEELGFLYETFKDKQAIWRNYGQGKGSVQRSRCSSEEGGPPLRLFSHLTE